MNSQEDPMASPADGEIVLDFEAMSIPIATDLEGASVTLTRPSRLSMITQRNYGVTVPPSALP